MPFSPLSRGRRRSLIGLGVAIATVSAFGIYQKVSYSTDSPPVNVTFVLGGGIAEGEAAGNSVQGTRLAVQGPFASEYG